MILKEEQKLYQKGFTVVGLDEVGRGSLAGPVAATAVLIKDPFCSDFEKLKLKDSKKLSASQREFFFNILTRSLLIEYETAFVSEKVIDKINILNATKLAMKRALQKLEKKTKIKNPYILIDGNFKIGYTQKEKSVIRGDETIFSCMVSSIISKVLRDRKMILCAKKYPHYLFEKNKGYPSLYHRKAIKKYGYCLIHRKSFNLK